MKTSCTTKGPATSDTRTLTARSVAESVEQHAVTRRSGSSVLPDSAVYCALVGKRGFTWAWGAAWVALMLELFGCAQSEQEVAERPDAATAASADAGVEVEGLGGDAVDVDSGMATDVSGQDEDDAGACDLREFAEAVQRARAERGSPSTCASPLPLVELGAATDTRAGVRAFIADVVGVPLESFRVDTVECGTSTTVSCARTFQHDLYKSNGVLGEALFPVAEQLESCASAVEVTIWVPEVDGITGAAVVCISGVWNAQLAGIAFFNELDTCP